MELDLIYNSVTKTAKNDHENSVYAKVTTEQSTAEQKAKASSTGEHGSYDTPVYENVIRKRDELETTANYKNEENHSKLYENVFRKIDGQEVKHSTIGLGENMHESDENPVYENAIRKTTEQGKQDALIQEQHEGEGDHVYEHAIQITNEEEKIQDLTKGKGRSDENSVHVYENVIRKTKEEEFKDSSGQDEGDESHVYEYVIKEANEEEILERGEENSLYVIRRTTTHETQELARQKYQNGDNHVYENAIKKTIEDSPSSSRENADSGENSVYENVIRKTEEQDMIDSLVIKPGGKTISTPGGDPATAAKMGQAYTKIESIPRLNQ